MALAELQPPLINVYCDESRQTGSPFLLVGSLWVREDARERLLARINKARESKHIKGNMKWVRVSRAYYEQYQALVDAFFDEWPKQAKFRCLVMPTCDMDYDLYSGGDAEEGLYKFYFQLLFAHMLGSNRYQVFIDRRRAYVLNGDRIERQKLGRLKSIINNAMIASGKANSEVVQHVFSQESRKSPLIQVTDILLGAVGYHLTGHDEKQGASPPRVKLAAHIASRLGKVRLDFATRKDDAFAVWRFRSAKKKRPKP